MHIVACCKRCPTCDRRIRNGARLDHDARCRLPAATARDPALVAAALNAWERTTGAYRAPLDLEFDGEANLTLSATIRLRAGLWRSGCIIHRSVLDQAFYPDDVLRAGLEEVARSLEDARQQDAE